MSCSVVFFEALRSLNESNLALVDGHNYMEIFEYDRDPFKLPHVINKFGTILFIMN